MKSYIVNITMVHVEPTVRRRVIMPAGATFNRLHEMIQQMTNFESHLTDQPHHFFKVEVDGLCITDNPVLRAELKDSKTLTPKLPTRVKIDTYLEKHKQLIYTYDFEADWRFSIELEEIVDDYHFGFPTLLDGEGTAPPENVGGLTGYASFLSIMEDHSHPEHDHMKQWVSNARYHSYDKKNINEALKFVKYKKTEWDKIDHANYMIISDPYRESEVSEALETAKPKKTEPKKPASHGLTNEQQEEVELYIKAMTRLYGMVQFEQVVTLYNLQNDVKITVGLLEDLLASGELDPGLQKEDILYKDAVFLGPKLAGIVPEQFVRETIEKPYYQPPKEQLLRFADPGYYERTSELLHLEKLFQKVNIPQIQIDRMLHTFMEGLSKWHANFMEVIGRLMAQAGPLPEEQVKQIVPVAINVANAVRLIENRGHTPQEMFGLERSEVKPLTVQPAASEVKVGRNDPCPCGSGKKYKKCCGR
ncbi:SEC-C metal-binding domain-containing protein [Sporosarcina gallistercoris]|uniref:IS1096 element passenger TnpR family protein n=1 Tax=Sporosarcina gallistercoris TaxID=2762245 RepID=UPI003D2BF996